jgi:ADP-ribosylglycohydrolase
MKRVSELMDKIAGTFFGCAIGDALGWPVEFNRDIQGGSKVVTDLLLTQEGIAHYTDDTMMTIAVADGLIRSAGHMSLDSSANEIAEEFIAWLRDPVAMTRGPGSSCIFGCTKLSNGVAWREAGKEDSKGCGTVMRSSPYGVFFYDEPWKAAEYAAEHSKMTHLHPAAWASAAALAAGIAGCFTDQCWDHTVQRMAAAAMPIHKETADMLSEAHVKAVNGTPPIDVLRDWEGWTGDEAIAASIYCCLRHPDDFPGAVLEAVNSPGDSDSLGAITGALMGAKMGLKEMPNRWVDRIENKDRLAVLSARFAKAMVIDGHLLPEKPAA